MGRLPLLLGEQGVFVYMQEYFGFVIIIFFSSKNSVGLRNSAQPCLTYGNCAASLQCHCSREAAACRARGKFLCFCSTRFLWLKEEPVQHSGRAEGHARLNSELCCYTEGCMGFVINCSAGGPK